MNIVCIREPGGGSRPVREGWRNVFQYLGHNFFWWDHSGKSAFDLFDEIKPIDILLGTTYGLNRATLKCLKNSPNTKVGLFCSAFGELTKTLDKQKFPIDMVSENELKLVEQLKKETGKPDFVFLHCVPSAKDYVIGGWEKLLGIKTLSIMNGADVFKHANGQPRPELLSDISFVGGIWEYKARNLLPTIVKLCHNPKYNIKIFGYGDWPVAQYLGQLDEGLEADAFASAKICPNISEPHSTDLYPFYDIVERVFKVSLNTCMISDKVQGINEVFETKIPMFANYNEMVQLIDFYLSNESDRIKLFEQEKNEVLERHTYFHRVAQMFEGFGMLEEKEKCLNAIEAINTNFK